MDFAVASSEPELDFRSPADDAWYGVRLSLRGNTLFVHYSDLAEASVDYFRAADFGSLAAVGEFRDRFRPLSVQLQDRDCRRVVEAGAVCACDCFGENDVRFYDADVEMACYRAHQMFDGSEEVCKCGFLVVWRHGPNRGRKTWTCIENICLMQDGHVLASASLHDFLRRAVKKIECNNGGFEDKVVKDMIGTQQNKASVQEIIGNDSIGCRKLPDDVDMGGGYLDSKILEQPKTYSFIMVDNLEKGLPSSEIIDFLYQHTSISCKAYVLPSFPSETSARGIIFIKDHGETENLLNFLDNPHHLIVSSRGRPWIAHNSWKSGVGGLRHSGLTLTFEESLEKCCKTSKDISIVYEGSEEYEKGQKLRELFMMFNEHIQCLHKRLQMEESML